MTEIICPRCNSEHTASRRMIHEQGVTNFAAFSVGTDGYSSNTSGTGMTEFSQRHSPPPNPITGFLIGVLVVLQMVCLFIIKVVSESQNPNANVFFISVWLIGTLIFGIVLYQNIVYVSSGRYARAVESYNKSFVCLRCGHIFPVDL